MFNVGRKKQRKWVLVWILLTVVIFVLGISMGAASVSMNRIIPILMGDGSFKESFVLFSVRLPRLFVLAAAGMALALAGAVLQGVTRNDLADPGIIGVNAGAGVGVTLFYLLVDGDLPHFAYVLPLVGFCGALLTAICIYFFSYKRNEGVQPVQLILVGVGVASALSGVMMILISSAERSDVQFIAQWLAGNVWGTDWPFLWALLPWLVLGIPFIFYKANVLNVLAMTEQTAVGLGVTIARERLQLIVVAVALAAAAVSITGGIAFIGLMAPHIAKQLVGPRFQFFLPLTLLIGASLLMLADTIGRVAISSATVPAGIVVACIGAPYFLYLLRKND
ncbi:MULTISPECIES: iron ABC transporter permease [unclassified Lysinibacillus]|uniref:FecCD family ABC transporter permease n=1 Tax=unclassified Lysinibacillus TaxID=2636778 RepID=UPI00201100F8|nr:MULTISPECIES: iron ABC transporter permease [unclassified Lysinibacillus]MCL1694473.1 iron ABC transporter permease [Lysinibacillus sp. BPa_S21]MCL1699304.1 iron ABC transporter permease [Lysinibacillus sp. Bpr_S20]